ncbi:DNA/RNA nuclease SfsA [Albimonas pacifica]|uniref:Sugar fermentation stimulation protein homolog n=1 Tax=Albimonas pacifica TaxID=1114924 RepID=A0A1I3GRN1_9RHOB|nr:DNA/RNA nuclease SfsA [Albimonas pacifica]SFI26158.1 sugar fermentation stimulation protein A [Albimonas pacifica]
MEFPTPLVKARLLRRYKRFLADAVLEEGPRAGEEITAHCANPGAMTGLAEPGLSIRLAPVDDPARKLRWSWKLAALPGGGWATVDTGVANRAAGEALRAGAVPAFAGYDAVRAEAKYGERSRIDFLLGAEGRPDCYVEVKSVTLRREGTLAEFPDAKTTRGARHLDELAAMAGQGARAAMLYLVQRTDCDRVGLAADIDPAYAAAFRRAQAAGVEAVAHACEISPAGVRLGRPLPVIPPA